jgi:hypothetical protein
MHGRFWAASLAGLKIKLVTHQNFVKNLEKEHDPVPVFFIFVLSLDSTSISNKFVCLSVDVAVVPSHHK